MRKNLLLLTGFIAMALPVKIFAQTPATVLWSLASDGSAVITSADPSAITATNQILGSGITAVTTGETYDLDNPNGSNTNWQKFSNKSAESSYAAALSSNFYTEYKVTAAANRYLQVNTVNISVVGTGGSTNRLAAAYSLDGFTTSSTLANPTATYKTEGEPPVSTPFAATEADPVILINVGNTNKAPLAGREILTFSNLQINVNPGQTLSIRFYYWQTDKGNRYAASKNMTIIGKTHTSLIPLPLDFLSFNASLTKGLAKQVKLNWSTTNEINTQKFVIEKSTGEAFEPIGELASKNTSGINHYSFVDQNPSNGTAYYKIKQLDQNGEYQYSSLVPVTNENKAALYVYPNPVVDIINISHPKIIKSGLINILDLNGKRVSSTNVNDGSTLSTLDLSTLPRGNYLLTFENAGQKSTIKILK